MNPPLQQIGFTTKPFGFKGLLKSEIQVGILNIQNFPPFLWMAIDGKFVPFKINEMECMNNKDFVLEIEDIRSDTQAFMLSGKALYCEKSIFSKYFKAENELENFIQFKIIDENIGEIGTVVNFNTQTTQENLIVEYANKAISIPFVEPIILKIDYENRIITTILPEGYLEVFG